MCGRGEVAVYLALFCSIMISLKSRRRSRVQYMSNGHTAACRMSAPASACPSQTECEVGDTDRSEVA
jgi:hypothetical protein